ncbi:MAG: DUF2157 domain-containing protein [Flavobacterium sp.]|nr:MAG: DUF2157 domain-containing protein [Flavobacterium sp.]
MSERRHWLTNELRKRELITEEQFATVTAWRSLGIFSVRNELLMLLYLSVLLFTTGIGIVIYKNIDSIGHLAILAVILLLTVFCFYFSFKNHPGYSRKKADFENPVFDYIILLGTLLSGIFLTYLQAQYQPFGTGYAFSALALAVVAFPVAYYFDNRSALSIAITALAAFIGITATPKAVLANEVYTDPVQSFYGIALGVILLTWSEYSEKTRLKKHFTKVYVMFALHLIGISCIKGMFEGNLPAFVLLMSAAGYYFYQKSYKLKSVSLFVFTMVFLYLTVNVLLGKLLDSFHFFDFLQFASLLFPVYFIVSIWFFRKLIKHFNKATNDSEE